jgi:hypothetical protein
MLVLGSAWIHISDPCVIHLSPPPSTFMSTPLPTMHQCTRLPQCPSRYTSAKLPAQRLDPHLDREQIFWHALLRLFLDDLESYLSKDLLPLDVGPASSACLIPARPSPRQPYSRPHRLVDAHIPNYSPFNSSLNPYLARCPTLSASLTSSDCYPPHPKTLTPSRPHRPNSSSP